MTPNERLPVPDSPVELALVGAGNRARSVYIPLLDDLAPWVRVVAVCDPQADRANLWAERLQARPYTDVRALVHDRVAEAALVLVPMDFNHSLVMFLAESGLHVHSETMWASMVCQAHEMLEAGRRNGVVLTVCENFPRMPIDRFAQTVRDCGYLGPIKRIVSYNANANYHNNARWLAFAQDHPIWVQSVEHRLEHPRLRSGHRRERAENYRWRGFMFPDDLFVVDHASNTLGQIGRTARPGYEEWHGTMGTLRHEPRPGAPFDGVASLHRCSGESDRAEADWHTPVEVLLEDGCWAASRADTPAGRIEYVNPLRTGARTGWTHAGHWYGVAVMDHIVDFALAVRGLREPEFTDCDALMTVMMQAGAWESARDEGRRVKLPLEGEVAFDVAERQRQQEAYGVDPLDVEAMLEYGFGRRE